MRNYFPSKQRESINDRRHSVLYRDLRDKEPPRSKEFDYGRLVRMQNRRSRILHQRGCAGLGTRRQIAKTKPSIQADGRIPSPYEASHAHRCRGPTGARPGTRDPHTIHTYRRIRTWKPAVASTLGSHDLLERKETGEPECARGRSLNLPTGDRAIVGPKNGTNDRPKCW